MGENITYPYIDEYLQSLMPKREGILSSIEETAVLEESYVPIVPPETAQLLRLILDITKPKKILEIGTAVGYSAMLMAKWAPCAHITTIERYEKSARIAKQNIKNEKLQDRIHIIEGDAAEILPTLEEEFDLVFMDGAKAQYLAFLPEVSRLLKTGGVLISDDVLYKGMPASRELLIRRKITIYKRLRKYLEHLMQREDFTTSIIPIGDGVAISYKKEVK